MRALSNAIGDVMSRVYQFEEDLKYALDRRHLPPSRPDLGREECRAYVRLLRRARAQRDELLRAQRIVGAAEALVAARGRWSVEWKENNLAILRAERDLMEAVRS